ncbi:hypothetical protein EV2_029707 [Malus domestica]
MAKRSNDSNSYRCQTIRSGLDVVRGGATSGCRGSERLAQHYGADAVRDTSNTTSEVTKYRRNWRKMAAQGGTFETQDLKSEITNDSTSYKVGKVEEYTTQGSTYETQDLNTHGTSCKPQGSTPEKQHLNFDDTSYTVEEYRQRRGINVEGCGDIPNPIRTFDDTRFPRLVERAAHMSSYLFAFFDTILHSFGYSNLAFLITAKVANEDVSQRHKKEIMEFGDSSPMLTPLATLALPNLYCFAGFLKEAINGKGIAQVYDTLTLQILLCGALILINLPLYQALYLRKDKGKIPATVAFKSMAFAVVACTCFKFSY